MSELERWMRSRLHDALGHSDTSIAQYLIKLTEDASSLSGVLADLRKNDIEVDRDMERLMIELYDKVNSKLKHAAVYKFTTDFCNKFIEIYVGKYI